MISSRINTFKSFNQYKLNYNNKSIDELCNNKNKNFELQPQQLFLKDFFEKNFDNIKQFLLYHEIGSGKTCTSIILAEMFLKLNINNKIVVILPARLKNNFYDELLTKCTNFKYFTKTDYDLYTNLNTSINNKQKLRKKFINEIDKFYNIISYEAFRNLCLKNTKNIIEFINNFSKNKMIIIDELHNLISDSYDIDKYIKIENTGIIDKKDLKFLSINSTLIKLLSKFSHNSTKLLFLTATPIYDSIKELSELTYLLNPSFDNVKTNLKNNDFKINLNKLKGKISYYPGSSKTAYPKSNIIIHDIHMSKIQDNMTYDILNTNSKNNDYEKEAFLVNQRQIAISCLSKKYDINKIINNLELYAPKIHKLISIINNKNIFGKHVIYTNFINVGVKVIEKFLLNNGWISIFDVYNNNELWKKYENKVFAIWSGNENDTKKNLIKNIINSNDNIYGNKIKLLIGSPSIKEGISFKHIQHIHLLDPVWNISGKKQIEGRAIRFCSHYDIKENIHKNLKRIINIHVYKLIPLKNKIRFIDQTVDQKLYDIILPNKYKDVEILEKYLKFISVDYHLFKKLYYSNTKSPNSNSNSTISINSYKNINAKKKPKSEKKTTCNPKIRRPNKNNNKCDNPLYPIKRLNKNNDFCCYKKSKNIIKTTCNPKNRRPINGKCPNNLYLRKNKYGDDCCYKFNK